MHFDLLSDPAGISAGELVSFDDGVLRPMEYEETAPYQIVKGLMNHREGFLAELFEETPPLFGHDKNR